MYEKPYPPRNPQDRALVRVTPKSGVTLNGPARELFTEGAVLVMYNRARAMLGFLPVPEGTPHSYKVRSGKVEKGKVKGQGSISVDAAMKSFELDPQSLVGSYEPQVEDGLITVQLRTGQDF
jgi:hypothetical protein